MKIKAGIVFEQGGPIEVKELDLDEPKKDEVLVKIVSTGICKSDNDARNGVYGNPFPLVPGHEGTGYIVKVGPNVEGLKEGDPVLLSYPCCEECYYCKNGMQWSCERQADYLYSGKWMSDMTYRMHYEGQDVGIFYSQSSFAEYTVVHKTGVVPIKEEDIYRMGPIGCGLTTGCATVTKFLDIEPDSSISITGMGGVGYGALFGAVINGCKNIIVADVVQWKLDLAKELGAHHTINSAGMSSDELAEAIRELTPEGRGTNYGVDTSSRQEVITGGIFALQAAGRFVCCAVGPNPEIPLLRMMQKSLSVSSVSVGTSTVREYLPKIVKWAEEGKFPLEKLIKFYKFEDIETAFDDMLKKGTVIKPVLVMPDYEIPEN